MAHDFLKKLAKAFLDAALKVDHLASPAAALPEVRGTLHPVADQMVDISVHLTQAEQALVSTIFGKELDPTVIIKHRNPDVSPTAAAITRNVNDIIFYRDYWSEEFTRETPFNFGNFVHEVTHIWQAQTNYQGNPGHGDYALHDLAASQKFGDFHSEHQGVIMEDYARRFLHPARQYRRIHDTPENDAQLKRIVEEQFPGAQQLRLAFEARQAAAKNKNPGNDNGPTP